MPSEKELILIFSINGCKFSIGIGDLIEVTEDLELSSENHSEECLGMIFFRGEHIPLVNIRKRLLLTTAEKCAETAAIVRVGDKILAIPIDSVEGVFEAGTKITPFPSLMLKEKDIFSFVCDWNGEFVIYMNLSGIYNHEVVKKLYLPAEDSL